MNMGERSKGKLHQAGAVCLEFSIEYTLVEKGEGDPDITTSSGVGIKNDG